jgi:hypothetical protein
LQTSARLAAACDQWCGPCSQRFGVATAVARILDRLRASEFAGLEGSSCSIRLAIDEQLANDLLARAVVPQYPAVNDVSVAFAADRRVDVRIKPALAFMPAVTLKIEIDPVITMKPEPRLTFHLRKQGLSGVVASAAPQLASKLPPEIHFGQDGGVVELGRVLKRWHLEWLVPLLTAAEIEVLDGQVVITMQARI